MLKLSKKNKAFTLIELMIVVVLIAILSGLVISVLNSAEFRKKARDNQRYADLKLIQQTLETYFADNRSYPATLSALSPNYISTLPKDPSTGAAYGTNNYTVGSPAYSYTLYVSMESFNSSNQQCQYKKTSPWVSSGGCADTNYCCVFRNP